MTQPKQFQTPTKPLDSSTLVLSGGAFRGSFQAGAYRALQERKFFQYLPIKKVYGTSVGALNAHLIASGADELLEEIHLNIVPKLPWIPFMRPLLKLLIRKYVKTVNNAIPLYLNIVELGLTGEEVLLGSNDFPNLEEYRKAILASASLPIPILGGPVKQILHRSPYDDETRVLYNCIDGGVRSPVINDIDPEGLTILIDTSTPQIIGDVSRNPFKWLSTAFEAMQNEIREEDIKNIGENALVIRPTYDDLVQGRLGGRLQYGRKAQQSNYELGYERATEAIEKWQQSQNK